jgi:hypothetical protein
MKRGVEISIGVRGVPDYCGGVGPLQNEKKETSKAQPSEKNKVDDTPGPARTLSGSHSGRAALRREQLESNHCEN